MTDTLAAFEGLVSPFGVISGVDRPAKESELGETHRCYSRLGSGRPGRGALRDHHVTCGGSSPESAEVARLLAVAEAAERYAAMAPIDGESLWASADELAGGCLEPRRYPRCSATEYAHPRCPVVPFDRAAPIRWVRGLDLVTRRALWVPAVMASYAADPAVSAEQFTFPISTGYAVHTDPVEAVVRGICEVVERDSVAVLWLQRLPLPPLRPGLTTDAMATLIEWFERRFMRVHLLDATSELGVPTVYAVGAADHDPRASRFVGAGTGRSLAQAAEKALLETLGGDEHVHRAAPLTGYEDIRGEIGETSRFMAARERAHAFDFLLGTGDRGVTPGERGSLPRDPGQALAVLTGRLSAAGMQVAVLDRTTQELSDVGLTAVNVVIPDLQPMSTHPWAQFKGHSRLYTAPRLMGYRVLSEEELNPWPQPFA
ncbi:YcaO-like family protein [Microtetraspora sp. NBRC 13810]|uniref:YcaO-like family protein n=1 Tax=Microtetraspora sp. NBRC 13810 TaxID=3030990 RepID=UPI0025579594|nr:YcaO-like family protein [Microtetraspora sp. NBRC 13810]